MTDLILCGAIIKQKDLIDKCIKSLKDHKFEKKYILFDGPPKGKYQRDYDQYKEYREKTGYSKIRYSWYSSMGGNPYKNNNSLLKIDINIFI